jgi:molybdopterin-guanine dinucleotide biosynthesis protein A
MEKLPVYILAGGSSSRFGSDKALADIDGAPLILRVAASLEPVATRLTVVADVADKYQDLGLVTISDLQAGLGPLGGIQTALHHDDSAGWILCAACDRIGIRREWLQRLFDARRAGRGVVAFRGQKWQPLPALYHASVTTATDESIACGNLTPWQLIQRVHPLALPLPREWAKAMDINDLETFRRWSGRG